MDTSTSHRRPLTHGPRLWYATTSGIVHWLIHLTALSALVNVACEHPWVEWVMHGLTVVLAAATLLALWWCVVLVRTFSDDHDEANSLGGRLRFMGWFGGLVEVTSLVLIVAEGLYVPFIDPCSG